MMLVTSSPMRGSSRACEIYSLDAKQTGFSLIELLISLLVFSVGILGLASLQITSMRLAQDAQQTYIAGLLAEAISNQLRVSHSLNGSEFWVQEVEENLPLGKTLIKETPSGYLVSVGWNPSEDQSAQQLINSSEYVLDVSL